AKTWNYSVFCIVLLSGLARAQSGVSPASVGEASKGGLKPLTVCEVLRDPRKFVGQDIAVIGRADSDELGFEFFLVEENCGTPLRTGRFVWPNRIWVDCCESFVPDPADKLILDEPTLRIKLEQLRRSTVLLTRKKIKLRVEGDVGRPDGFREVKDFWEVGYGRIEVMDRLDSGAS